MKRYAFYMLVMAVAAVAACQKESAVDNAQEPAQKTYTYTVKASIDDVKSDYDDDGKFSWSAGDAISVLFHNGEVNKFFTLTTTASGTASASFSGEIETGYVIGASDQTGVDKKIWALFPASDNHTYTAGSAPTFYVQPSVDFSATHFSANIPMFALNAAEGAFSFANLACTYKFTVSGIKDGVSKVRFSVYNQTTYALSGGWPISYGSDTYINYNWASPGSANSTLTYVGDVTNNEAVFYVSSRFFGTFQPNITVTNYADGVAIKTFTAANADTPNYMSHVKPITLDVSEANGGYYSAITVDGNFDDWGGISALPSSNTGRIREWKFKNDDYYVYFYFKLRKNRAGTEKPLVIGFNTDNDTGTGAAYDTDKILGNEALVTAYPFTNAVGSEPMIPVQGNDASSKVVDSNIGTTNGIVYSWGVDAGENMSSDGSSVYVELSIPKDKLTLPAAGNAITIGCAYDYYVTGTQSITLE